MKITTHQLANKLPEDHNLLSNHIVNPEDYSAIHSLLKEAREIIIFDATTTKKHPPRHIISVSDHINKTGKNPLIGHQKELDIDFIDLTKLYNIEENAVQTHCCGKKLNKKYPYPSHYLCHISILAKALEIKKISAFLVNIV